MEQKDIDKYYNLGKYVALKNLVFDESLTFVPFLISNNEKCWNINADVIKLKYCPNFRYHDYIYETIEKCGCVPDLYLFYRFNDEEMVKTVKQGFEDAKEYMFYDQMLRDVRDFMELSNISINVLANSSGLSVDYTDSIIKSKCVDKNKLQTLAKALSIDIDEKILAREIRAGIKEESPMMYNAYAPEVLIAGKEFYGDRK